MYSKCIAHGGGWHPDVGTFLSEVAQRQEATKRSSGSNSWLPPAERLAQQLSVTIQSCLARGTLRRSTVGLDRFQ